MPFYREASKVFYWSLSQQPKICFEKNACADRKYFQNETLGYDHFGYRKHFVLPDTDLKSFPKMLLAQLSMRRPHRLQKR